MIRIAKNGCSSDVTFIKKNVYFDWDRGLPKTYLGKKLNKTDLLKENLINETHLPTVENLMIDWELYENGWHVVYGKDGYKNKHLFYYLQQMGNWGSYKPEELEYFK